MSMRRRDDDRSVASLFSVQFRSSLSLSHTLQLASGPAPVARPLNLTASAERWAEKRRRAREEQAAK